MNVISTDIIHFYMAVKKTFVDEYVQGKNMYS